MKRSTLTLFLFPLLFVASSTDVARAAIGVGFAATSYEVTAGGTVDVSVVIDGDTSTAGLQPISGGLFSFGVSILLPSGAGEIDLDQLQVEEALNFDGFLSGAGRESVSGSILVRGNVNLSSQELTGYGGTTLLTLTLRPNLAAGTSFQLGLATAAANAGQVLFVNSQGVPLDADIEFSGATVNVMSPEPREGAFSAKIRALPSNRVEITFDPFPGSDHFVQFSTDLKQWINASPVPQNSGRFEEIRTLVPRYYRVIARSGGG